MDSGGGQALSPVLFIGLLILGFYLLAIRPQRARAKALSQVQEALQPGARVMTSAGLHATVAALEGREVLLEVAPGVQLRFDRGAVIRVLDPVEPAPQDEV